MFIKWVLPGVLLYFCSNILQVECSASDFSKSKMEFYKNKVKSMFYHAYNGYLDYAYPLDELKPLTCKGMDTWGSFSLTLIDSLDTLLIMGNRSEFNRAVQLVLQNVDVDANVNVSVFETNIRVVGGLLSAHLLSGRHDDTIPGPGWPCSGPLLDLAVRFATKLLPAFNTDTGMPYGTVNLKYGVNRWETPITCTAGVGTFIIEFGTLSRLTGDPTFERVAMKALEALWKTRSGIGLVGNHINTQTGHWTATDAGIGAGIDSYFEYLAKGGLLFQRPKLLQQFYEYEEVINEYVRKDDWFFWVSMSKGTVSLPIFQSLEAFWPGVLALLGKVRDAERIILTYLQVNRQFGLTPEFYNLQSHETNKDRAGYPLRPELIESLMYIYRATKDPTYLYATAAMVEAIEFAAKTDCGYATIKDVNDYTLEDRMESFFLAETTKYLYLIFDEDNFIHNDGSTARMVETTAGRCVVDAGGYIFNTEAHPIDPAALYCCSKKVEDVEKLQRFEDNISFISLLDITDPFERGYDAPLDEDDLPREALEINVGRESRELPAPEIEFELESEDAVSAVSESDNSNTNPNTSPEAPQAQSAPAYGVDAMTPLMLMDLKTAENKRELAERIKVNKEVNELIKSAQAFDEKQHASGNHNSNLAEELSRLLTDMRDEYRNLLRLSVSIETPTMEQIKIQLAKRKIVMRQPISETFLDNECVLLDRSSDSVALRRMLNIMFSKHFYHRWGIPFVQGPVCRPHERPLTTEELYKNESPPTSEELASFDHKNNEVEDISFSTFRYRLFAEELHLLLTSETPSFASRFAGLGQVVLQEVRNKTRVRV